MAVTICRTKAQSRRARRQSKGSEPSSEFQPFIIVPTGQPRGTIAIPSTVGLGRIYAFTKKAPHIYFRLSARAPTVPLIGKAIPLEIGLKVEPELTPPLHFKFITACYEFKASTQLKASNGFRYAHTWPLLPP